MESQNPTEAGIKPVAFHEPVMVDEALDLLKVRPDQDFIDGTVGLGGHSRAILEKSSPEGRLLGIDRDEQALTIAKRRLSQFKDRVHLFQGCFDQIPEFLSSLQWTGVQGALFDLGVSSLQLESSERGFSFRVAAPLDMRMGGESLTAKELVNTLDEAELADIFFRFGEERFSRRIARTLVRHRQKYGDIQSTEDLQSLVAKALGAGRRQRHPATRVFQALRIAVNRELEILQNLLIAPPNFIQKGGVMVVISYHSLEDRIVKHAFRSFENFKVLTKKPWTPTQAEVQRNPRARSAKLRAIERVS